MSSNKRNYRSFNRVIKDCDLFGHRVQLNFNKNGRTHNTILGGCSSIVFYVISLLILVARIQDISRPQSSVISFFEPVNQEIELLQQGISVKVLVEDLSKYGEPIAGGFSNTKTVVKYTQEMKKYLTITFVQT
jgi:hypothetical protein